MVLVLFACNVFGETKEIADLRKELDALKRRAGTNSRFAELTKHGVTALPEWEDEVQASGMDELV